MKRVFFRVWTMMALAFLAAAQFVRARELMVVSIPFAFTAGKMAFPAGDYTVEKQNESSSVLLIRRADCTAAAFVQSKPAERNSAQPLSQLTFHRYGNRYFLSQVWVAGSLRGRELPKSAEEKEQALAARNAEREEVTIVARLATPKR
jgi:hypothetical protein